MRVALLHKHPTWSDRLIATLNDEGIDLPPLNGTDLAFETGVLDPPYRLPVNRRILPRLPRPLTR